MNLDSEFLKLPIEISFDKVILEHDSLNAHKSKQLRMQIL